MRFNFIFSVVYGIWNIIISVHFDKNVKHSTKKNLTMLSETYLGKCNFLKRHYYQKNNPFIKLNYDETCLIASVFFYRNEEQEIKLQNVRY